MGTSNRILHLAVCGVMLIQGNNVNAQQYCPRDVTRGALQECFGPGQALPQRQVPVAQQLLPHEQVPYGYPVVPVYVVRQPYVVAQPIPPAPVYAQPLPAPVVYPQPVAYGPTPDAVFGFFLGAALMAGAGRHGPAFGFHPMRRR